MMFKEYYSNKYPHLKGKWGTSGEDMTEVFIRFFDTVAEYLDEKLNKKKENE